MQVGEAVTTHYKVEWSSLCSDNMSGSSKYILAFKCSVYMCWYKCNDLQSRKGVIRLQLTKGEKTQLCRALRNGETECEICPHGNEEDMVDYLQRLQGIGGMWEEGRGYTSPHYIQYIHV